MCPDTAASPAETPQRILTTGWAFGLPGWPGRRICHGYSSVYFCVCSNHLLLRSISQLHTNLLGSMLTCKAAMKTMIQQGGSIVNVGEFSPPGAIVIACKHGAT